MIERRKKLTAFLFAPESDQWLGLLRVGLGLQVILYSLGLQNDWIYLLGGATESLNGRALSEGLLAEQSGFIPRLGWLISLAGSAGISDYTALTLIWWTLFIAGLWLFLGFFSRGAAIVAWFIHLCVAKSGDLVAYGVDNFMTIGLFYLMWSPLPDRWSLDWRRRGKALTKDPRLLGFFRRVLQIHLCIIYLTSGIAKCLGSGWWNGSNVWRALTRPPFDVLPPEVLLHGKLFFPLAGVLICLLEVAYPFLVWRRRTRLPALLAICLMHVMIGLAMGMYLFALVMIVLNLAAFGPEFSFRFERIVFVWLKKEPCLDRLTRSVHLRFFQRAFLVGMSRLGGPHITMYTFRERICSRPDSPELKSLVIGTRSSPRPYVRRIHPRSPA